MKLEEAIGNLLEVKEDFDWDLQHKNSRTNEEIELANKYSEAIKTILQALENSISKKKIEEKLKEVQLPNVIVGGRRNGKTLEYGIKLGRIKAYEELLEKPNE